LPHTGLFGSVRPHERGRGPASRQACGRVEPGFGRGVGPGLRTLPAHAGSEAERVGAEQSVLWCSLDL